MEEDNEVLDWGNEDDEQQHEQRVRNQLTGVVDTLEDAEEDAVSLGGDDDDAEHYYAYQAASHQDPHESSIVIPKASSVSQPQQQQFSHGNGELQRDVSSSSLPAPAQSQHSPQQHPSKKLPQSQSLAKMTHSLPPKPVVSIIPFMQPTHPSSLTEATAMSLHRDKKSNGSIGKPVSTSDVGDPLPPDWEVKQSKSGGGRIYYYNVRTHLSTWIRPVNGGKSPAKDKERGRVQASESRLPIRSGNTSPSRPSEQLQPSRPARSEEPQVPPSALSYDDRHYRPGEVAQITNVVEKRREERFESNKRSSTPPRSPRLSPDLPLRPSSPIGRGRDEKRPSRSHRKLSPTAADLGSLRDSQREKPRATPRVSSPDRHWIAPQEPPPRKISGRRPASSHDHHRQHEDVDMSPATPTTNEGSGFRNDAEWSSTLRHRSPPHLRDARPTAAQVARTSDSGQPSQSPAPRAKSRFDQPASTSSKAPRVPPKQRDDIYIPADLLHDRSDRELELTSTHSTQIGVEHEPKQRRANEHERAPLSASNRRMPPDPAPVAASLTERSTSDSSSSQVAEQSRLKRTPLPPQAARFREMSRRPSAKSEPAPFEHSPQAPPALKDGGMMPRATNIDSSLPSGPRYQPQVVTTRDASQTDLRNSARLPPSGPSAGSTSRTRRNDPALNAKQQPSARDRNAMDVDFVPPSRPPPIRVNDTPIRVNSGMYADREPQQQRGETAISTDAAPRGPRAMTNKMPASSSNHSFAPSPSISPTTLIYPQRPGGGQEHVVARSSQRSPPPHLVTSLSFQSRDGSSAGGMSGQNEPARASNASERGQLQGHYPEAEPRDQSRREAAGSHGRHDQFIPPPAPRGFSGPNSIPIGNRKGQNNGPMVPSPQTASKGRPSASISDDNVPARNRSARGPPAQNSFEIPPSPVDEYSARPPRMTVQRETSFTGRMTPPHQHRPLSPSDSFQTSAVPGRSRGGDNWLSEANMSHPGAHPLRGRSPPRTWTQRPQHPEYEQHEPDFREVTPPPLPRDTSWDDVDRRRLPTQFRPDGPHHVNQYNGDVRHETGETRHRRPLHLDMDRGASHPIPHRSSAGIDTHLPQHSDDRFVDDTYRSHSVSPRTLRRQTSFSGHESYNDVHRHGYADNREEFTDRQAQSWDRVQDAQRDYQPVATHNVRPDRSGMFETNSQTFAGSDPDRSGSRSSKPVRIRRPGAQSVQNHPDDFPVRQEVPTEHWASSGDRGDVRSRDEPGSRGHSHHQRPAPSRRGASLLDRLSIDNGAGTSGMSSPSLRDRVQTIPAKRDRDEMGNGGGDIEFDDPGLDDSASKKPRRRLKARRGRRSGTQ